MKIIAVGMNYAQHNKELGHTQVNREPVIFMKPDSAILKDGKPFFVPDFSAEVHYETEVVVRIGVSMAKGICYGRNVPLIGIPTLEVLSVPVLLYHELPEDALLCPMIDARRMEVYAAIYDRALNVKREISADIVDENSYLEYLEQHPVYFFGNGAAKCREKITHPNAHFIDDLHPLAKMMFPLAEKAVAINDYKDVAYFEPFYLKEFVASQPKKLL